ncbi:MAG: GAF domain-containing protein [Chroococcidiopsidaceae cyanobacterium CP_BM_RX_35]|nr:GAF domain-containing protein [Chroococcidiopsidaceae cyanobacterium CP_BM_RX_35]
MAEREHHSSDTNRDRYTGKLWSGFPIAQEPLLLLAELASELSTATDLETLQQILARKLRWIVDFDRCTLAVRVEALDNEYLLFETTSPRRAESTPTQEIPIEEGVLGRVIADSQPYFIQDLAQLASSMDLPAIAQAWGIAADARSLMVLPLRIGERTIGSLNFSSHRTGVYSVAWRNLTSLLAAQVGGQLGSLLSQMQLKSAYECRERAMESAAEAANLALERQVQERTLQLQQALDFEARLKRITDKVRDSLDESQIVEAAVKELALGLNVGCCNMALYNLEQGTSTICYEYAISIPASQGRISQMANYPELYRQLLQNQYFQFCSIAPHPHRGRVAMLACPISDDQGVIGDLWLVNQKNHVFHELEIRLVQQVTNQCAIAIRQARLYQAATAQVAELEKLNQLKDDFLSTVSHELRTPISNMKLAIHMLQVAPAPEARERYLKILQYECIREAELINDLLDLQRLEAAAYTVSQDVVNLVDWLPRIIEPFRVRSQERQLLLHVELPLSLPPLISDSASLGRILAELLNNACKYTLKGGKIDLSVSCESSGTATPVTCFTIGNEAEIPAAELPRIFEKFYRVPNSDPWRQGGTGLGLALVQKLVERLKGTISVTSSQGWTKFTLRLPNRPQA